MYKVRSENGYGFLRPGLKTGVGNGIFWSEIGSGFGDVGGTPQPKIPRSIPPLPRVYKQVPQTLNVITVLHTPSSMVKPIICMDIL